MVSSTNIDNDNDVSCDQVIRLIEWGALRKLCERIMSYNMFIKGIENPDKSVRPNTFFTFTRRAPFRNIVRIFLKTKFI